MDKVKIKDEILMSKLNLPEVEFLADNTGNVTAAMDEFANQEKRIEAIEFAEWVAQEDEFTFSHKDSQWYNERLDYEVISTDELYERYLQNKNKQP